MEERGNVKTSTPHDNSRLSSDTDCSAEEIVHIRFGGYRAKITVMTNNDFEAIGCMRSMETERLKNLYVSKTESHNAAHIS